MKSCAKCNKLLDESCFNKRKTSRDGLRYSCKQCEHETYQAWKDNNPEKAKEKWRKASAKYHQKDPATRNLKRRIKNVGISETDYTNMLVRQNFRCKICNTTESETNKGRLHIDHCHSTGKVRGLLCSHCNTAIGLMKDDVKLLQSAIAYLT